jgi:pimeloyl-ACP methyl ester carboxylesterase
MSCLIALGSLIAALLLLSGCSLYHHAFNVSASTSPKYEINIVQLDDFGSFWDASIARTVLSQVEAESLSKDHSTYVVVFIHGWHNNAAPENENLLEFKDWLGGLSDELSKPERANTRKELTGSTNFKLIGVYMAWRGRSLPKLLDYGTMWWRKSAAERVGDGDASEFLERLQRIYLRANSLARYRLAPDHTPFMGLLTIGHSFGGQVLLNAVARPLEEQLVMRAPCLMDAVHSAEVPPTRTVQRRAIDSFGDLNVLVNPALEAYQFARIDGLYKQLVYSADQTPQLVVFSADNDVPRAAFFPIARALTSPFRPRFRNSYQGKLWGRALGELKEQQTHDLNLAGNGTPNSLTDDDFEPHNRHLIVNYDFTSTTVFAGARLERRSGIPPIENSPVSVVVTHDKIIDGHNGVFDPGFMAFLQQYIAFIEGKRVMLRYQELKEQNQTRQRDSGQQEPVATAPLLPCPDTLVPG